MDDDRPSVAAGSRALRGTTQDPHGAGHEVLPHRPPDEPVDGDVGSGPEAADEVAGVSVDDDVEVLGEPHGEVVTTRRIRDGDAGAGWHGAQSAVDVAG